MPLNMTPLCLHTLGSAVLDVATTTVEVPFFNLQVELE
jgi:hypothetical protein